MLENKPNLKNQTNLGLRTIDIVAAYTLLRIVVGINYFNHGASSQLIHNIVLFILLAGLNFNSIFVDGWLKSKRD